MEGAGVSASAKPDPLGHGGEEAGIRTPWAWTKPSPFRCPRCGTITLTRQLGARCPGCGYVESET